MGRTVGKGRNLWPGAAPFSPDLQTVHRARTPPSGTKEAPHIPSRSHTSSCLLVLHVQLRNTNISGEVCSSPLNHTLDFSDIQVCGQSSSTEQHAAQSWSVLLSRHLSTVDCVCSAGWQTFEFWVPAASRAGHLLGESLARPAEGLPGVATQEGLNRKLCISDAILRSLWVLQTP